MAIHAMEKMKGWGGTRSETEDISQDGLRRPLRSPPGQPTRETSEESVPDTGLRSVLNRGNSSVSKGSEAGKSLVWLEGKEWEGPGGGRVW